MDTLRIADLWAYMLGSRTSIERFGRWRGTIWLGLLFVLSAGLAREYDREDLLHEPWHLLLPLGVSLVTSLILYTWLFLECWRSGARTLATFLPGYWQFLGWYWLTAPLAWLYAVPYEQFLSPLAATQLNYLTLAIVALWRVLLMIRIAHIAYGMAVGRAAVLVLAFATVVAFLAVNLAPKPIFDVMAGVRLSDEESFIQGVWLFVTFFGFWIGVLLLIANIYLFAVGQPRAAALPDNAPSSSGGRPLWVLAAAGLAIWLPLLFWTQPPEQRRWRAERMLQRGEIDAALAYLSQFDRNQLPPHFNPPPRLAYRELQPDLAEIVVAAQMPEVADWVRELFEAKWEWQISGWGYYRHPYAFGGYTNEQLRNLLKLIEGRPDREEIARDVLRKLNHEADSEPEVLSDSGDASSERAQLREQLRRLANEGEPAVVERGP